MVYGVTVYLLVYMVTWLKDSTVMENNVLYEECITPSF
jgi:hypothetical protein